MSLIIGWVLVILVIMMFSISKISKWNSDILMTKLLKDIRVILAGIIISITFLTISVGFVVLGVV